MDWFLYGKDLRHERVNPVSTHFKSMFHLYIPWKHQIIPGFMTFSEGIEMEH